MESRKQNPIYMTRKEIGELVGYSHTAVDNRASRDPKTPRRRPKQIQIPF